MDAVQAFFLLCYGGMSTSCFAEYWNVMSGFQQVPACRHVVHILIE